MLLKTKARRHPVMQAGSLKRLTIPRRGKPRPPSRSLTSRSILPAEEVATVVAVGFSTFVGVWLGSLIGGLGIDVGNIAATSFLGTLVGFVFGALSLALSAATGQVRIAIFGTVGAALAFHLVNSFASLNENLASWAKVSPFAYYLNTHPLENGMDWGNAAVLAGLVVILLALAVALFQRRDLRQSG